jgi:hypothetical protein
MPKRTPEENQAISDKVDLLLSEGYPLEQATAIAFRMYRDGELYIPRRTRMEYRSTRTRTKSLIQAMKEASVMLGLDKLLTNKNNPR